MAKGKALAIPVPGPGRKSLYREEYADQAFKLCLLGATDEELAEFFCVAVKTIYNWKDEHPAFLQATIAGKVKADAEVAHSLYRSATGHEMTAEKVVKVKDEQGERFEAVRYKQFVPADPNAAYKWLCNRRRTDWRDRHEVQHDVSGDLASILLTARTRRVEKQTVFIGEPDE
jgi:transposase